MKRIQLLLTVVLGVAATNGLIGQSVPPPGQGGDPATVTLIGTGRLIGTDPGADDGFLGIRDEPEADATFSKPQTSGTQAPARVPADHVPTPAGNALASEPIVGFNGVSHRDQRLAPTGSPTGINLSLTPPDQGLAVGNGFVVEAVNNAVAVYSATTHARLRLSALSQLFGLAPTLDVVTGASGPFLSDPRVYYDWPTGRFFLTELEIGEVPATGAFDGTSALFIAVSQTSDPTGLWNVYRIDTTHDGIAAFGACPCFGDQPLIGADANGFYLTTNAFSIDTERFRGGQVYAISKAALVSGGGGTITARRFSPTLQAADTVAFSIQPATVPPGGTFAVDAEFFMSSLDPNNTLDNRLTVWALTGTHDLATATLTLSTVATEVYGFGPAMQQRPGPTPLLDQLANGPSLFADGSLFKNHLELIESNDDRLQQVVYAAGRLWTGLNGGQDQERSGPGRRRLVHRPADAGGLGGERHGGQGRIPDAQQQQRRVPIDRRQCGRQRRHRRQRHRRRSVPERRVGARRRVQRRRSAGRGRRRRRPARRFQRLCAVRVPRRAVGGLLSRGRRRKRRHLDRQRIRAERAAHRVDQLGHVRFESAALDASRLGDPARSARSDHGRVSLTASVDE
jgi:hypothetical protein